MATAPLRWASLAVLALLTSVGSTAPLEACSRVFSQTTSNGQAMVVGRTMDLYFDDGAALALRPRGIRGGGMVAGGGNALSWKARYGSVGVLSAGKVISDGMNERGLNANLLYLSGTRYETVTPGKPALSNVRLVDYMLDNFATVAEGLAALKKVQVVSDRVLNRDWPVHLSLADRSGDSAVVEFIDGRMVVHRGTSTLVMTNEPSLDWQLNNLKRYKPFGGSLPMPGDVDPASRFVRGSTYLKTLPRASSSDEAEADVYAIMKNIAVVRGSHDYSGSGSDDAWTTLWTTVANLNTGIYYVQVARNPYAVWVDIDKLRLQSGGPMRVLSLKPASLSGDVSQRLNRS